MVLISPGTTFDNFDHFLLTQSRTAGVRYPQYKIKFRKAQTRVGPGGKGESRARDDVR